MSREEEEKMDIKERIKRFGEENRPFYLCAHDDGTFSLCRDEKGSR